MIYYTFSSLDKEAQTHAVDRLATSIGTNKTPPKGKKDYVTLAREVLMDDEDHLLYTNSGTLIGMLVRTEDIEC